MAMRDTAASDALTARLTEAERRLGGILAMTTEAIICVEFASDRIVVFNRGAEEIFGYSAGEVVGKPLETLLPEAERERHRELVRSFVASGSPPRRMNARGDMFARRKNGELFEAQVSISAVGTDGGTLLTAVVSDLTQMRRAEAQVAQSERQLRDLVKYAAIGIYRATKEGRLLEVNPALVEMLGYASEQELLSVGETTQLYADPRVRRELVERFGAADRFRDLEVVWKRKDGSPITVSLTGRTVRDKGSEILAFEVFVANVTTRVELSRQLQHADRLESVGRLAGGVAHDFNNLLTVIGSYCDLVLLETGSTDPRREDLRAIRSATDRAAQLARQLLTFSRKRVVIPKVIDLNEAVRGVDSMIGRVLPTHVAVALELAAEHACVRLDSGLFEQLLMNLVINASDAMPNGGELHIKTANVVIDSGAGSERAGLKPGDYVSMSVRDTGAGMDAATMNHIFEPFYTTKAEGKGTGLGLATVYSVAKEAGGNVVVASVPGRGSEFTVFFPQVKPETPPLLESTAGRETRAAGTLLIVDDDPAVRNSISRILAASGYSVIGADHAGEALRIADAHKGAIDLVISDVQMPEMTGPRFIERFMVSRPQTKVLFMSGFGCEEALDVNLAKGRWDFIAKPFTSEEVTSKVRRILAD